MKPEEVHIVVDADVEIEPAPLRRQRLRCREFVDAEFELLASDCFEGRHSGTIRIRHLEPCARDRLDCIPVRKKVRAAAADEQHPPIPRLRPLEKGGEYRLVRSRGVQDENVSPVDVGERRRHHVHVALGVASLHDHQIVVAELRGEPLEVGNEPGVLDMGRDGALAQA